MTTIKAYTDLSQSKVLSGILPLESADMYWMHGKLDNVKQLPTPKIIGNAYDKPLWNDFDVPCWSLAALYNILRNNKKESTTLSRGGWKIKPIEYLDNWWCEYEDESHTKDFTVSADNPIDACYEMILKLHELKML